MVTRRHEEKRAPARSAHTVRAQRGPSYVVVDTEGSGLHPDDGARISTVSWAYRHPKTGIVVADAMPFGQGPPSLFNEPDAGKGRWNELMQWLSVQRLVFHNAKYDLLMFGAGSITGHPGVELGECFWWDTMVAQRHLDPLDPVGLDATCKRLGLPTKDDDFLKWKKNHRGLLYSDCPWDVMKPYAVGDAVATLLLAEQQQRRLDGDEEDWPTQEWLLREMEVTRTLYRMEQRGVAFAAQDCLLAANVLETELAKIAAALSFRPNSTIEPREFYFGPEDKGGLGMLHIKTTPGGKASMDEEVRRALVKQGAPQAAEYDRWCSLETALSMWYRAWPEKVGSDGRLRTNYRQTKVVSGRFSVERVQLQAIPHDYRLDGYQLPESVPLVRSFFHPAEGKRLWEFDVSQAEVRVATWAANCREMREAIERGESAHDVTCRRIFEIEPGHPDWERKRAVAKRIRLGTIYGAEAPTIRSEIKRMEGMDFPVADVRQWVATDRAEFPEFVWASVKEQKHAEQYGYVHLAADGIRWFSDFELRTDGAHKAFNQRIQGSVAMVMNLWMLQVEREHPGVLLLQIHDSLVCELDEADDETPGLIAKAGEEVFAAHFDMPFVVDRKPWK